MRNVSFKTKVTLILPLATTVTLAALLFLIYSPVSDGYTHIKLLRYIFIIILPLLSLGCFRITCRYLHHFTDQIIRLTRHVESVAHNGTHDHLFKTEEGGEIGVLANAFNCLISQLDQQKAELLEQELVYRTVVDLSYEMVFWISADRTTIHYVSPSCQELTGYSPEDFYRAPALLNAIISPEDNSLWHNPCHSVANSSLTDELGFRIITKNGDVRWVSHLCRQVVNDQGETVGFRGSFSDITARKLALQQLHRQNEYLLALHETTLGLIRRQDLSGVLRDIVIRAGKLVGTEHCYVYLKNSVGTAMDMRFQSGIFDKLAHHAIRPGEGFAGCVWQSGEPLRVNEYARWEGRLAEQDCDLLQAMAGVPLKIGSDVIGVLGLAFIDRDKVFSEEQILLLNQFGELASLAFENARLHEESKRELAERKRVEQSLRKLSVAVEQNPVSIVITDTSGAIEYVNPHFTKDTGYSFAEALGQNPRILKTGKTSPAEYQQLWDTIRTGGEWRGEFHNRKKNGDIYWEQALIAPIRDEQGAITHFIALKENITERKMLENQLFHAQKMEAIGRLAGGISHDFNNILTAIIGFSSIIQMKLPQNSPLIKTTEQLIATAECGSSLTQGLLAFSRKQESNPVVIDLNEILARIEQLLLRLINAEIHLDVTMEQRKLPILADSVQIEQVVINLVANARDALQQAGVIILATGAITMDSDFILASGFGQAGDYAVLTCSDTGMGMDSETLAHVFEPFYTTKEMGKGTGLGLSIVYAIIKKFSGFITCQSQIGSGTTFTVYLPLMAESRMSVEMPASVHAPDHVRSDVILLAEDNKTARMVAKKILEEFGYTVYAVANGQEAVDLFKSNPDSIDLIVLDFIMPGMNGLQVCQAVRSLRPKIKVLFCSGYSEDEVVSMGLSETEHNLLLKPYTPKELLMKIREVIDNGA
jgi:PAS domain S-box-containing protein